MARCHPHPREASSRWAWLHWTLEFWEIVWLLWPSNQNPEHHCKIPGPNCWPRNKHSCWHNPSFRWIDRNLQRSEDTAHGSYSIDSWRLQDRQSSLPQVRAESYWYTRVCVPLHMTLYTATESTNLQLGNVHSWTSAFRYCKSAESLLLCPWCVLCYLSLHRESCILSVCLYPWPSIPLSMYIMVFGSCGLGPSLRNAMGSCVWGSSQRGHRARDCGEICAQAS